MCLFSALIRDVDTSCIGATGESSRVDGDALRLHGRVLVLQDALSRMAHLHRAQIQLKCHQSGLHSLMRSSRVSPTKPLAQAFSFLMINTANTAAYAIDCLITVAGL